MRLKIQCTKLRVEEGRKENKKKVSIKRERSWLGSSMSASLVGKEQCEEHCSFSSFWIGCWAEYVGTDGKLARRFYAEIARCITAGW